jgi:hypothetical protein
MSTAGKQAGKQAVQQAGMWGGLFGGVAAAGSSTQLELNISQVVPHEPANLLVSQPTHPRTCCKAGVDPDNAGGDNVPHFGHHWLDAAADDLHTGPLQVWVGRQAGSV